MPSSASVIFYIAVRYDGTRFNAWRGCFDLKRVGVDDGLVLVSLPGQAGDSAARHLWSVGPGPVPLELMRARSSYSRKSCRLVLP